MRRRTWLSNILGALALIAAGTAGTVADELSRGRLSSADREDWSNNQASPSGSQPSPPALSANEIADRVFKRENAQVEKIENSAPIVETYIQEEKSDALMGTVPKKDFYFLGQGDFHGKTMKVHSMIARTHKGSIMWSYEPAGFLQMAFLDSREF